MDSGEAGWPGAREEVGLVGDREKPHGTECLGGWGERRLWRLEEELGGLYACLLCLQLAEV